ncbi:MAG: helix-turn-helix transcriptional regulator [Phycisphaerales bacterium]
MAAYPFVLLTGGKHVCTPAWSRRIARAEHFHRLYFPSSGRAVIERGLETCDLQPSMIYLIPSHMRIAYRCEKRMALDWLHLRLDNLEQDVLLAESEHIFHWPARQWAYWRGVYRKMDDLIARPSETLLAATQAMLMDKVGRLVAQLREDRRRADPRGLAEQLRPAITFMDARFVDNPPLSQIASTVHLSPTHFHRLFRRKFGLTPHDYMLRKRMSMAATLLQGGRCRVGEAAGKCGYDDLYYFSRVFRQYFGRTAQQVRHGLPPTSP